MYECVSVRIEVPTMQTVLEVKVATRTTIRLCHTNCGAAVVPTYIFT